MYNLNNITNDKRIEFIKQNAPQDYYDPINKLDNSKFIFIKSEHYNQCFITIDESDNTRTQLVVRFDNGFCEISDLADYCEDLSTQWKKFVIREEFFKNRQSSKNNSKNPEDNQFKRFIDLKDCIVSYMIEFQTPVVAHSEIDDWAMFLQNCLDKCDQEYEVLNNKQSLINLRKSNDDLITVNDSSYTLNDYHDEDDLNSYLLQENFDEELLKELINAQGQYRHLLNPSSL